MPGDYSTHTEHDAGISAGFDAYPDPPPIERYELAAEQEWMRGLEKRVEAGDVDPHGWPREFEGPLLEALQAALCDLCGAHAATDHGLCRACADFLRDERSSQ